MPIDKLLMFKNHPFTGSSTVNEDPKPTAKQLQDANMFAKQFAMNRHLFNAQEMHVGDTLPKFVDSLTGKEVSKDYTPIPSQRILNIVPDYVKELQWDAKNNLPYFIDDHTGDIQYVKKDWFYTDRFNPNRGKNIEDITKK